MVASVNLSRFPWGCGDFVNPPYFYKNEIPSAQSVDI
jgi:hypothetical protein